MRDNKMLIKFVCPVCGQYYETKEKNAGKTANCKKCKTLIKCPNPEVKDLMDNLVEKHYVEPKNKLRFNFICLNCNSIIVPNKGCDTSLKVITWLCFIVGLCFWPLFLLAILFMFLLCFSKQESQCPVCSSKNIVPLNSPKGQSVINSK